MKVLRRAEKSSRDIMAAERKQTVVLGTKGKYTQRRETQGARATKAQWKEYRVSSKGSGLIEMVALLNTAG